MENNFNLKTFPQQEDTAKTKTEKGGVLVFTNVLLTLITIGLGIYIFLQQKDVKEIETKKEKISKTDENTNSKFVGKQISATLPEGWEIIEYEDGNGSKFLMEGVNYKGLTGLEIKKEGKEIMTLSAIDGFGSTSCPALPHFTDSSENYEKDIKEMVGYTGEEFKLLDYTEAKFSEYKWFDRDIRRINTDLYYDTEKKGEFFEPQCVVKIITFETPIFESNSEGESTSSYQYQISDELTEKDLRELDRLLESMEEI